MNKKIKILLAEDEPALGQIVKESLETRDFEVLFCQDGDQAYTLYKNEKPEVLVLDVMMPKKDGFTLAKQIRDEDQAIPIIFLTAKSQTSDVVDGFKHGGNDYLKKPFSMEELIVRIHALLNRVNKTKNNSAIAIGDYQFNYTKQELSFDESNISLTHREAELLYHLTEKKNEILDRSFILKKIWGDDDFFNARSMDVFITKLRKKLKQDSNVQIVNVRGYGYKLIC
ncbi:response regulator transcription factor [Spongiivirga sp. MCCC 1A20706]|uniref:response regulator transcription factor n=1 Tax=Spongiivirga sp. MCCC 1A20706 TaxID=3160963 RepID=UPI003977E311